MSQYRSILKATSIFGGTQIIQILVRLIQAKFTAVLIGPVGAGINSVFSTTTTMFITIFGLGISTSVVRDMTKAFDDGNMNEFAIIDKVFKKIMIVLSLLGALCIIVMSHQLSQWGFNESTKTLDFCLLSITVYVTLMGQANDALITCSRRIKDLAKCSLIGSLVSVCICVPFYYFLRLDGIVPGMIVSSVANYFVTYYYSKKVTRPNVKVNKENILFYGKRMISLGVAMVIATLAGNVTNYLINIGVSRIGSIKDLGLFNSGMSLTTQAIGLIFSSMTADYYPRLVTSLKDKKLMNETVNQQSEILLYLAVPILALLMIFAPLFIRLLLTKEYLVITTFIRIICFGMLFKAASYALGYISFAKGDKTVYLLLEAGWGNISNLILGLGLYYLLGITGMAIAFAINYFLYYIIVSIVDKKRYCYERSKIVNKAMLFAVVVLGLILAFSYSLKSLWFYIPSFILAMFISYLYIRKLNEKTGLIGVIKNKLSK